MIPLATSPYDGQSAREAGTARKTRGRQIAAWAEKILLGAVVCTAYGYWLVPALRAQAPAAVVAVARPEGDIEFTATAFSLAQGFWGERAIYERRNAGLVSYPVVPQLLHAAFARIAGPWGFVAADMLCLAAFFAVSLKLFERFGLPGPWRLALAFVTTVHPLFERAADHSRIFRTLSLFNFWGWRYPRPLVSSFVLLAALILLAALLQDSDAAALRPSRARRHAVLLALALAALLQSDPYSFLPFAWFGLLLALRPQSRRRLLDRLGGRAAFGCAAVFLAASLPFLAQRVMENADVPARLGLFHVPRFPPLFLEKPSDGALLLFDVLVFLGVLALARRRFTDGIPGLPRWLPAWRGVFGLCAASWVSLPLTCLLTGRVAQPYHFPVTFHVLSSYCLLIGGLCAAQMLGRGTSGGWRIFLRAAAPRALILAFASTALTAARALVREEAQSWRRPQGWHPELADLHQALARLAPPRAPVLGTLSVEAYTAWLTSPDRYSFLTDPFPSPLPDSEIEERLIAFCRLIGMETSEFLAWVSVPENNARWLGANKYHAFRAHAFRPLHDYAEEDRRKILTSGVTGWCDSWQLLLPTSEKERLARLFRSESTDPERTLRRARLDLIVLDNSPMLRPFSPPADRFELVLETARYRVWRRRP